MPLKKIKIKILFIHNERRKPPVSSLRQNYFIASFGFHRKRQTWQREEEEEEEEGRTPCLFPDRLKIGGRRRRHTVQPGCGSIIISQPLLLLLLPMKRGMHRAGQAGRRGGGGRSNLDVLGLHHLGKRLLHSEGGEARGGVMSPALGHQLQHGSKALRKNRQHAVRR